MNRHACAKAARFLLPLLFAPTFPAGAADDGTESVPAIKAEPPKVHNTTPLRAPARGPGSRQPRLQYPDKALHTGEEALITALVDVDEHGRVSNIRILDEGFGALEFQGAVRQYLRELRLVPATVDGQPVVSRDIRMPVRFRHGSPPLKENRSFQENLRKVIELLEARDFANAQFHAESMLAEDVKRVSEYAVLQATLAQTSARMGDFQGALQASRAATGRTSLQLDAYEPGGPLPKVSERDFLLTTESLRPLLQMRFVIAAAQGAYVDALNAHADLQALGLIEGSDPLMAEFDRILAAIRNDPTLTADIRLNPKGRWSHDLLRRSFTLTGVEPGQLQEFFLSCSGNTLKLEYASGFDWNVPASWEKCSVHFRGEPGANFQLLEFRDDAHR